MSETKLLRCPFCGGEAVQVFSVWSETYRYGCYTTGCMGNAQKQLMHFKTDAEAIKAWNTRKPMQNIAERLEEEKSELTTWAEDEAFKIAINKAIEIVKEEGGVNDKPL